MDTPTAALTVVAAAAAVAVTPAHLRKWLLAAAATAAAATVAAAIMNDQADLEAICEALLLASATLFGVPKISDNDNVADPETLEMSVEQ